MLVILDPEIQIGVDFSWDRRVRRTIASHVSLPLQHHKARVTTKIQHCKARVHINKRQRLVGLQKNTGLRTLIKPRTQTIIKASSRHKILLSDHQFNSLSLLSICPSLYVCLSLYLSPLSVHLCMYVCHSISLSVHLCMYVCRSISPLFFKNHGKRL